MNMISRKKRNHCLVLVLALCLLFGMLPGIVYAEEGRVTVSTWEELKSEAEKADGAGTIYVDGALTAKSEIAINRAVTICSENDPFTVTRDTGFKNSFFTAGTAKSALTLSNIVLDGNGASNIADCSQLVVVRNGGSLVLGAGAVLQNNHASNAGGGVYVYGGTLTMKTNSSIVDNTSGYGSGGVSVSTGGAFTMEGGSITGNTSNTLFGGNGGGVSVSNVSKFRMTGGTISGNTSQNTRGGGVYVNNSTFTMETGSITGNQATGTNGWGGGVFLTHGGVFTMTGGSITNNTASAGGGGVAVAIIAGATGRVDMQGGSILDNMLSIASAQGAEVYTDGPMELSGVVQIGAGQGGVFLNGEILKIGENGLSGESWVYLEEIDGADEGYYVAVSSGETSEAEAAYFKYLPGTFAVAADMEGYVLKSFEAPAISGPDSMSLEYGYAAAATEAFTVMGVPAPVVKISGPDKIIWDETANKLNIAPGLEAGSYPVTLTADNNVEPKAVHTFTLTVNEPTSAKTYSLSFDADGGTPVPAVQQLEAGATPVAVANPVKEGHAFLGWYDEAGNKVELSVFYMPEHNVLLKAKWEKSTVSITDYLLTVENGDGGGRYKAGEKVNITAKVPKSKTFVRWEIRSGAGKLEKADSKQTVFTMGESDTVVRAVLKDCDSGTPLTGDKADPLFWGLTLSAALTCCVVLFASRKYRYGKHDR